MAAGRMIAAIALVVLIGLGLIILLEGVVYSLVSGRLALHLLPTLIILHVLALIATGLIRLLFFPHFVVWIPVAFLVVAGAYLYVPFIGMRGMNFSSNIGFVPEFIDGTPTLAAYLYHLPMAILLAAVACSVWPAAARLGRRAA